VAEVEGFKGVGWGLTDLILLWKRMEKSKTRKRPVCPLGSCVDGLVAFQPWKKLDGAAGFLLGEAQVVERL
jgi:hypothetical protein